MFKTLLGYEAHAFLGASVYYDTVTLNYVLSYAIYGKLVTFQSYIANIKKIILKTAINLSPKISPLNLAIDTIKWYGLCRLVTLLINY